MSRIRVVRSTTRQGSASVRFLCWVADSSRSKITRSTPVFSHTSRSSSSRPLPMQVALSGASRFWISRPVTRAPAVRASSSSSSRDISTSNSPVSRDTRIASSGVSSANGRLLSSKWMLLFSEAAGRFDSVRKNALEGEPPRRAVRFCLIVCGKMRKNPPVPGHMTVLVYPFRCALSIV